MEDKSTSSSSKSNIGLENLSPYFMDLSSSKSDRAPHTKSSLKNKQAYAKIPSHALIRRTPDLSKNLRAKTIRIGKVCWPPPINPIELDHANEQRRLQVQRRIQEEIHGNVKSISKTPLSFTNDTPPTISEMVSFNKNSSKSMFDIVNCQRRKNLFEYGDKSFKDERNDHKNMRTETNHEVGKLISYFEKYINDINRDLSKSYQQPIRTTSQNTSNLSVSFTDIVRPVSTVLPTIIDDEDDISPTTPYRAFSDDIYDQLTYQTSPQPNSFSSPEQIIRSSVKSTKRRRHYNNPTNKKRLYRRRPPSYIKELKAYLAHRESLPNEIVKISDVKRFSNVLVWLSNQSTTPSSLETSTRISLIKNDTTDNNHHASSVATDSAIVITHDSSQLYSEPVTAFTDEIDRSKLSAQRSLAYITYNNNVRWRLKVRKEIFSPNEAFDQPLLIELLYLQIVHDVFSSKCVRISEAERINMKIFLSSHGVATIGDIGLIKTTAAKKDIIEQARHWPLYFCRLFSVSVLKSYSEEERLLGISHSGIRIIKQSQTETDRDKLQVVQTFPFDTIENISSIRNCTTMDINLTNKRITIRSQIIQRIKQMIENFLQEFRSNDNKQSSTSNQKVTSPPVSTTSDLFKSSSQTSLMSCSQTFSELIPSTSIDIPTPNPTKNDITMPTLTVLPSGLSMMEFALQNFKIPNKRRSKKSWKTSDWTWQDYAELIKWSKTPIQTPLLRRSSNDSTRILRQCFLSIMRYMGDHSMQRGQNDVDCLTYILKHVYKQRSLIDEILCQIIKQLTDNKSTKTDSTLRGWKLLAIILNYFVPSEHLRPYFMKYLQDNTIENEKRVRLCLHHYEQTLKYGGRKNLPSKAEIDLLTASSKNGGKRQSFLLPSGFPLTVLATPSLVIDDCLRLLCDQLQISGTLEYDEYSIFIVVPSEHSSRLLCPTEYLFDIISECARSTIIDYHFIMKRMLWYNVPPVFNANSQSEVFINFMYHQLVPELVEGNMIVLDENHLSDKLLHEIAELVALQYRASNKIGLPAMRDIKSLLPVTVTKVKTVLPQQWTLAIHEKLCSSVESMSTMEAKTKFLNLLKTWSLFGATIFPVETIDHSSIPSPCLIGVSKIGILFLNLDTRETLFTILHENVASIRHHHNKVDIKYNGGSNHSYVLRCQVDKAQDLVTLTARYLNLMNRKLKSISDTKNSSSRLQKSSTSTHSAPISTIA